MSAISNPFSLYTNAAGQPLDGASIYIGQAGQNPESAPVTVYWDEAKTIPAAQPLRTVAGFIRRNGSPANAYFAGAYSIVVKDKNGVLVFSDLNRTTNADNFITWVTTGQVVDALGFLPVSSGSNEATMRGKAVVVSEYADFSAADANTLQVQGADGGHAALMQFVRPGQYALKFGLDYANTFGLGGYSQGNLVFRWTSDASGNFTALGNVTAYSDMRRKTDIEQLANVAERILQMRGFTYLDTVTGQRRIGVGAQEVLQAGYSEAVVSDDNGTLSVAYGQLALPLLIEYVRELETRLARMQAQINEQKG